MQNLKQLSDAELLNHTKKLAGEERKLTTEVLWHLKEVESRRLFSCLGFSSVFEYCVEELKYSHAAAARRVASMRLLKTLPEVASSIEKGSLNLSTVSAVQTFFNREEKEQGKSYSLEAKRELLQAMENKSKREVEQILITRSPESAVPGERERKVTATQTELRILLSEEGLENLERAVALLSHQVQRSKSKTIELLIKMALEKIDPEKIEERAKKRVQADKQKQEKKKASESELGKRGDLKQGSEKSVSEMSPPKDQIYAFGQNKIQSAHKPSPPADRSLAQAGALPFPQRVSKANPRFIPAALRRQVLSRDGYQCSFIDHISGRRCQSKAYLEIDHRTPIALGGKSDPESLRTLCRSHNQWEAIRLLGKQTMASYFD